MRLCGAKAEGNIREIQVREEWPPERIPEIAVILYYYSGGSEAMARSRLPVTPHFLDCLVGLKEQAAHCKGQ